MADRDCYNYHLQTSRMVHNHLLHTGSVILAWGRQTPFHDWRSLIVWRFKSGLKSIITISTRSIISRFKLGLTETWPGGWWRHKNLTAGVSCRGGPIKWTRWWLVSRISWDALSLWVRKHPGSGWGWLRLVMSGLAGDCHHCHLSWTRWHPCLAQSEYNTPSAHYMLIPDPCSASSRTLDSDLIGHSHTMRPSHWLVLSNHWTQVSKKCLRLHTIIVWQT